MHSAGCAFVAAARTPRAADAGRESLENPRFCGNKSPFSLIAVVEAGALRPFSPGHSKSTKGITEIQCSSMLADHGTSVALRPCCGMSSHRSWSLSKPSGTIPTETKKMLCRFDFTNPPHHERRYFWIRNPDWTCPWRDAEGSTLKQDVKYTALSSWSDTFLHRGTTGARRLAHMDSCRWCSWPFRRPLGAILRSAILVTCNHGTGSPLWKHCEPGQSALWHLEWDASIFVVANCVRFGLTQCSSALLFCVCLCIAPLRPTGAPQ